MRKRFASSNDIGKELLRIAKSLVGGRAYRAIVGKGWTEKEALDNALKEDEEYYGHGEGYGGGSGSLREVTRTKMVKTPKRPKRVKITKTPVRKGPIEKRFIIKSRWESTLLKDEVSRDHRYSRKYEKQSDVLKVAKELALQYSVELNVELQAFCVGNTQLATITPEKGQLGEWVFDCEFAS